MSERSIEHASFVIERSYDASPAEVFAAWADPAAKARWLAGPEEWEAEPHVLDFRVGGREVSSGGPSGGPIHIYRAIYWDIVPNERIVYTYEMLRDETRISVSLTTVDLKPEGEGTRLLLTEHAAFFDGLEAPELRSKGTGSLLDALAQELRGGSKN
jgi:uncharacterized protein YndB with AHSA1/START domain